MPRTRFFEPVEEGAVRAIEGAAGHAIRATVGSALFAVGLLAIISVRAGLAFVSGGQDPATMTADQLKSAAAMQVEVATAPLGSGIAFDIVQTSTMKAKPGGPLIDIPNADNGREIIGKASEYPYYTLLERGIVRSAGFWSEIRSWPVSAGPPDYDKAELRRSALVRDGVGWRNDREGWYEADVLPGIGLDPATAKLLPALLRDSVGAIKREDATLDGSTLLRVDATAQKSDIPGIVAADGKAFTKLIAPIEFGFDATGRLVRIHAAALNTNLEEFDLVVDTVITLTYEWVGDLPRPDPVWKPAPVQAEAGQ